MGLLPLELVLTIGASSAVFMLGVIVWLRNRWATGTLLYALMAVALSIWTSADWFLLLQSGVPTVSVIGWKLFFYLLSCAAPAVAIHAAGAVGRRPLQRGTIAVYVMSLIVFVLFAIGLAAPFIGVSSDLARLLIDAGAILGAFFVTFAMIAVGWELYPLLHTKHVSELAHRRAAYGLVIIIPFLAAGLLQFIAGPLPVGFAMPFFATWFLVFSLTGFARASFLNVELGPLEGFFLFLAAFGSVLVLRSNTIPEIVTTMIGLILVGAFGFLAIWSIGQEREKRHVLEATNRELQYLEHAKNDFLDMVAHQLRGPLGGIRSSSAMLREGDYGELPERARIATGLIESSASRLLSLAETFLDASRLDAGTYRSERVSTDVRAIVAELIAEIEDAASSKKIRFNVKVDASVPKKVTLDAEVLRQSLFNLLDNAVKYTATGEVTGDVSFENGKIQIEIRDTGIGFSEEEGADLFHKFHRGRSAHVRSVQGTGLGLYIVRRLLEAAGGRIHATSEGAGRGSAFRAELPAEKSTS
ncbi:HAMP domain-containing histidine kinase [Patescibacteria group bacterium]|nr:HAMP domain-containing histidine kinase [Patescibacteria group bacterium]